MGSGVANRRTPIAEILAALSTATPGPWGYDNDARGSFDVYTDDGIGTHVAGEANRYNAHLIANARIWLPELCDRVEDAERSTHVHATLAESMMAFVQDLLRIIEWSLAIGQGLDRKFIHEASEVLAQVRAALGGQ